ncbi:hypothetical protein TWF694_006380 [Orbilia ellipsospora]|uniref:Amidase domain-containing protein n=1 Tax=Orbilia ellipsospora TaxID=2528407 RepID=A0AAV9XK24_9PEZI
MLHSGSSNKSCKIDSSKIPDLIEITIDDLTKFLNDGCFTSHQLTQAYIARINEVNPKFHAVTEINPDALSIAKSLDAERTSGKLRGPLHGVPILLKDNIATADQMNNTASSYALLGAKVPKDSMIAAKLRAAGAIILGKTGMSQWASFRCNGSGCTNGWGSRHGQITSAYYPNLDPSGSSSGSGVASSLGLALASIGTDTSASIISPSERNCLVGIRPTVGLTSRHLVIPISEHQDTIGPMARTVRDAAYILSAIAGKDADDKYTANIPFSAVPEYWKDLQTGALKGAKIGIPRNLVPKGLPGMNIFDQAVETMRKLGANIIDTSFPSLMEFFKAAGKDHDLVLGLDFKTNLKEYLSKLTVNPHNIHNLEDLIEFTKKDPREDYPKRDIDAWIQAMNHTCHDNTCAEFKTLYEKNTKVGGQDMILGALDTKTDKLDALILPSFFAGIITGPSGYPAVTVPIGFKPANEKVVTGGGGLIADAPGVPLGVSFLGRKFDEQKLINFAFAYEQETQVRAKGPKQYMVPKAQVKDFI